MGTNIDRYFHHLSIARCSLVDLLHGIFEKIKSRLAAKVGKLRDMLHRALLMQTEQRQATQESHYLFGISNFCSGLLSWIYRIWKNRPILSWHPWNEREKKSAHTAKPEKRLAAPGTRSQLLCFPGQRLAHAKSCKVIVKFFSLRGCSA